MPRLVTLAQLRADARLYADQRPGGANAFINDPELTRLVNLVLPKLYDLLVSARGEDYYSKRTPIPGELGVLTTVASQSDYNLPADFYQLISVKLLWSTTDWEEIPRRHTLDSDPAVWWGSSRTWQQGSRKEYQLAGGRLRFVPIPTTTTSYVLTYVPICPVLSADDDSFDGVNGWEDLVALGVALRMHGIQESDGSALAALYREAKENIETMVHERVAGLPSHVIDVQPERGGAWPW